jgi:hypothetical protein
LPEIATNHNLTGKQDGNGTASGQPVESWKRAAEVTNALKAKIEQMKVIHSPLSGYSKIYVHKLTKNPFIGTARN